MGAGSRLGRRNAPAAGPLGCRAGWRSRADGRQLLGRPSMARPNVHTASRDELRDANVRADVIDEIVKRRRRKGGLTLASLAEVPGVGPATLEQLGQALDFTEPPGEEAEANDKPQPPQQGRPANGDRRGGSDDQAVAKVPEPAE